MNEKEKKACAYSSSSILRQSKSATHEDKSEKKEKKEDWELNGCAHFWKQFLMNGAKRSLSIVGKKAGKCKNKKPDIK